MDMQCWAPGLSVTFKPAHLLPLLFSLFVLSYHPPILVAPPKKPQDISLPYVSFSFIRKKKTYLTSFLFQEDFITQSPYGQTVSDRLNLAQALACAFIYRHASYVTSMCQQ